MREKYRSKTDRTAAGFIFGLVVCLLFPSVLFAQDLTDPYEILNRFFEAGGGLERLKAEQSYYTEGEIVLAGMTGSLKQWSEKPGKNRTELALGPLNITQGSDGETEWVLDQNGKLQIITSPDDATAKRRQVRALMADYAYADHNSGIFTVTYEGYESANGAGCYLVKITNNINADHYTYFINAENFRLEKEVIAEGDEGRTTYYSDYREIDGLTVPFSISEVDAVTGQRQDVTLSRYESNPPIEPITFEPPEQAERDYSFVAGDRAEDISFRFIEEHLFVPVMVNGNERLWVLDTGAGVSVIDKRFAEELGLELEGDMKGRGVGGTVDVSFARLPPISLEGIEIKEQTVAVIDMTELLRRVGLDVVGILGFDFLSRFVTKVDYANELLSFYEPSTFAYTGDGQILDMHIKGSVFTAKATLDGTHSGTWLIDLGASRCSIDESFAKREGYFERKGVNGLGHGAAKEYTFRQIKCDSLQFSGFTVHRPLISYELGAKESATSVADQMGTLGNNLFRNFVIYCDYAHERLIVEKGEKFDYAWPEDRSGLNLAYDSDKSIEVIFVSPDTPADNAGLRKGDKLISIDGVSVSKLNGLVGIRKMLRADPGTSYDIVIDRNGVSEQLKLTLAPLL